MATTCPCQSTIHHHRKGLQFCKVDYSNLTKKSAWHSFTLWKDVMNVTSRCMQTTPVIEQTKPLPFWTYLVTAERSGGNIIQPYLLAISLWRSRLLLRLVMAMSCWMTSFFELNVAWLAWLVRGSYGNFCMIANDCQCLRPLNDTLTSVIFEGCSSWTVFWSVKIHIDYNISGKYILKAHLCKTLCSGLIICWFKSFIGS